MTTSLPAFGLKFSGPNITVGSYRSLTGREGRGYSGTLLLNGVKVGSFADWGDGGEPRVSWTDRNNALLLDHIAEGFTPGSGVYSREECESASLDAYPGSRDTWIVEELAAHEELFRKLNRASAKKTIYVKNSSSAAPGYTEINSPFTPDVESWLIIHHGANTVRVWVKDEGWKTI